MQAYSFSFQGHTLEARADRSLWWPAARLLVVSDLHLGKSERMARRGGALIPPYEIADTLGRLGEIIRGLDPETVICLGDSFDDLEALDALADEDQAQLASLIAGRNWIWIEGNHDAGPVDIGGTHRKCFMRDGLTFQHIAETSVAGEISGHYHPKARVSLKTRTVSRPAFLTDGQKLILPAFGTYTGGLRADDPIYDTFLARDSRLAILTGTSAVPIPLPQ